MPKRKEMIMDEPMKDQNLEEIQDETRRHAEQMAGVADGALKIPGAEAVIVLVRFPEGVLQDMSGTPEALGTMLGQFPNIAARSLEGITREALRQKLEQMEQRGN